MTETNSIRRKFLRLAGTGMAGAAAGLLTASRAHASASLPPDKGAAEFNVRAYGATGSGTTLDTAAINQTIQAASTTGGTVRFPAGTYLSYSIRLKSNIALYLEPGAVILAALTAAAIAPDLFSAIVSRNAMESLTFLLDTPVPIRSAPELFCLDLYQDYDLNVLEAIASPVKIISTQAASAAGPWKLKQYTP